MATEEKREKIAEFSLGQARRYKSLSAWGRSFPHYLVFGQLKRQVFLDQHLADFLLVVGAFSLQLERDGKPDKVLQVYEQAIELLPEHPKLLTNYAGVLFNQNKTEPAEKILRKVLSIDCDNLLAKDRLENLAASLLDRWHFPMLNDAARNGKFQAAIERKVKEEACQTILDIGTGTGLLSLYASKAGANAVYACEASEVMAITAKEVFTLNPPHGSKIRLIPKLSMDLDNTDVPEPIQLLITETFDAGLLGEHVLISLNHAWHRQLQYPSPRNPLAIPSSVVPASADFYVVPITSHHIDNNNFCHKDKYGYINLGNIRIKSNFYSCDKKSGEPYTSEDLKSIPGGYKLLAQPKLLFSVNFQDRRQVEDLLNIGQTKSVKFQITEDGVCHAMAGWFTLHLDQHQQLSTAPQEKSCWQQAIFPVLSPPTQTKVYKNASEMTATFKIHKHVQFETFESRLLPSNGSSHAVNGNGCSSRWKDDLQEIELPPSTLRYLNCPKIEQIYQWLAYYASRDVACQNILDLTGDIPLLCTQFAKTSPTSKFTLKVDTSKDRDKVRCFLDFLTALAKQNGLPIGNFSCITDDLSDSDNGTSEEHFNLCLVNPVLSSGRLDQTVLLGLQQTLSCLVPNSGLVLPHKLQLWAQLIQSDQLCEWTHLRSNQPVDGFRIADQLNILAVTHQQELKYSTLDKKALCEPVHMREVDLTKLELTRHFVNQKVKITESGTAHAIIYWFVIDFGWNLHLSTLESEAYSQAAVMCKHRQVNKDDSIEISAQMEDGLLYLHLR